MGKRGPRLKIKPPLFKINSFLCWGNSLSNIIWAFSVSKLLRCALYGGVCFWKEAIFAWDHNHFWEWQNSQPLKKLWGIFLYSVFIAYSWTFQFNICIYFPLSSFICFCWLNIIEEWEVPNQGYIIYAQVLFFSPTNRVP